MTRPFFFALLAASALLLSGCDESTGPRCPRWGTVIYSNSFETAADTAGWGLDDASLVEGDTPPGGGKRALRVAGGGCFFIHHELPPLEESASLVLRSWGKNLSDGGSVVLRRSHDGSEVIGVRFERPDWCCLQSEDTLHCPAGSSLTIECASGTFGRSSPILVDRIEIVSLP